jgi:hypothetical protein
MFRTSPHSRAWRQDHHGNWWRQGTASDAATIIIDGDNTEFGYVLAGSVDEADRIDMETFGRPAPTAGESAIVHGADLAKCVFALVILPALYIVAAMGALEWMGRV